MGGRKMKQIVKLLKETHHLYLPVLQIHTIYLPLSLLGCIRNFHFIHKYYL